MLDQCSDHLQQNEAVTLDQSLLLSSQCQGQSRAPQTLLRLEVTGFAATQPINYQNTEAQSCPHLDNPHLR